MAFENFFGENCPIVAPGCESDNQKNALVVISYLHIRYS